MAAEWISKQDQLSALDSAYSRFLAEAQISNPDHYGLRLLTAEETLSYTSHCPSIGSIEIPYFSPTGTPLQFKRYRFLAYQGKNKYIQNQPGVEVYLPPMQESTWEYIAKTPNIPICITEGEKKAIAATNKGALTIGLGGVYSFSSITDRMFSNILTSRLSEFKWKDRDVYIIFDYDGDGTGEPKPQVRRAELILTAQLAARRARVHHVRLGHPGLYEKVGLDDFLSDPTNKLQDKLRAAEKNSLDEPGLIHLLSEYADYDGKVLRLSDGKIINWVEFTHHTAPYLLDDNKTEASKAWRKSKWRLNIESINLLPHETEIITKEKVYNTWRGVQTVPISGSVEPWLIFKRDLFSKEPHMEEPFDQFIACLLQRPWHKQYRLPIMRGIMGAGKSFLFETICYIINGDIDSIASKQFGTGAVELGPDDLDDSFNAILGGKVFAVFNEPGEKGSQHTALIKNLVTSSTLTINDKFRPKYTTKNFLQIAFTTNMAYTHILDYDSRREMVVDVDAHVKAKTSRYFDDNSLPQWRNEHLGQILHYYLNYDLGDYTGRTNAPHSKARDTMIRRSVPPTVEYIRENLAEVPYIIVGLEFELFKSTMLDGRQTFSKRAFSHALEDNGYLRHDRADRDGWLNLTPYGLGRVNLYCKEGYHTETYNPKIAEFLKTRYNSSKASV